VEYVRNLARAFPKIHFHGRLAGGQKVKPLFHHGLGVAMYIEPAAISNVDFDQGNPTESLLANRGGTNLPSSEFFGSGMEGSLRGPASGPSLPRVGQNQPQVTTTALAAPIAGVTSSIQTTEFIEEDPGEILDFKEAGTTGLYQSIAPNIDLQEFLKRPVHVTHLHGVRVGRI